MQRPSLEDIVESVRLSRAVLLSSSTWCRTSDVLLLLLLLQLRCCLPDRYCRLLWCAAAQDAWARRHAKESVESRTPVAA